MQCVCGDQAAPRVPHLLPVVSYGPWQAHSGDSSTRRATQPLSRRAMAPTCCEDMPCGSGRRRPFGWCKPIPAMHDRHASGNPMLSVACCVKAQVLRHAWRCERARRGGNYRSIAEGGAPLPRGRHRAACHWQPAWNARSPSTRSERADAGCARLAEPADRELLLAKRRHADADARPKRPTSIVEALPRAARWAM